jgi:hypothetical protein
MSSLTSLSAFPSIFQTKCLSCSFASHNSCSSVLEQSMRARNRVGTGLLYRPVRLHRLVKTIPGLFKILHIRALSIENFSKQNRLARELI